MPRQEFFNRLLGFRRQLNPELAPRSIEGFCQAQTGVINGVVTVYAHELLGNGARSMVSRVQGMIASGIVSPEQLHTQADDRFDLRMPTTIQLMVNEAEKKGYLPPRTDIPNYLLEKERTKRNLEVTTCEALVQKAIKESTISSRLRAAAWRLISQKGNKLRLQYQQFDINKELLRDIQAELIRAENVTELSKLFDKYTQEVCFEGERSE
jgi:hypothetical protein